MKHMQITFFLICLSLNSIMSNMIAPTATTADAGAQPASAPLTVNTILRLPIPSTAPVTPKVDFSCQDISLCGDSIYATCSNMDLIPSITKINLNKCVGNVNGSMVIGHDFMQFKNDANKVRIPPCDNCSLDKKGILTCNCYYSKNTASRHDRPFNHFLPVQQWSPPTTIANPNFDPKVLVGLSHKAPTQGPTYATLSKTSTLNLTIHIHHVNGVIGC